MIISHKHRYIFIKTSKTAGTSIEIALSRFCGPEDVITPISQEDETTRQQLGHRGPQNVHLPLARYTKLDLLRAMVRRKPLAFYNHAGASFIKRYVDPDVWASYFKFCFERNPWDKAVSLYYWRHKCEPRPSLSAFVQSGGANTSKGFELYTIDSEIVVDRVFRFESLESAMTEIRDRVGLESTPTLPRAKGTFRKDPRNYREILSEADRAKIAKVFAREIAHFDYRW